MFLRLFAIILLTVIFGVTTPALADSFAQRFIASTPPQAMPALSFEDGLGRQLNLKDFKGRYVLLNLWATWCIPCVQEMPTLSALYNKFDYRVFAIVALIEDHDGLAAAQSFYSRHGIQHLPIYVDVSGQAPSLVHVRGLPTTILIDPNGFEVGRIDGEVEWTAPEVLSFLQGKMKR